MWKVTVMWASLDPQPMYTTCQDKANMIADEYWRVPGVQAIVIEYCGE